MTIVASYWEGPVIKGIIVLVGAVIWGVVNDARKKKVADEFHLDPKVILPFDGATFCWSDEVRPQETQVPALAWVAEAGLFVAAFISLKFCLDSSKNWEYWLGASVLFFALCPAVLLISRVEVQPVFVENRCQLSSSRVILQLGRRTEEFEIGKSLLLVVGVDEVVKKRGGGQMQWEEFLGYKYKVSLRDGYRDVTVPMDFVGSGEFLASCQDLGAKVEFATDCPPWFVQKIKSLPCWKPGYFRTKASPLEGMFAEFCCAACGGRGRYPSSAATNICQYCGSAKLNPA